MLTPTCLHEACNTRHRRARNATKPPRSGSDLSRSDRRRRARKRSQIAGILPAAKGVARTTLDPVPKRVNGESRQAPSNEPQTPTKSNSHALLDPNPTTKVDRREEARQINSRHGAYPFPTTAHVPSTRIHRDQRGRCTADYSQGNRPTQRTETHLDPDPTKVASTGKRSEAHAKARTCITATLTCIRARCLVLRAR